MNKMELTRIQDIQYVFVTLILALFLCDTTLLSREFPTDPYSSADTFGAGVVGASTAAVAEAS
jgi:hypothetical protein